MKKLGKLSINPEKVMKNEELVSLRGGYGEYGDNDEIACWCLGSDGQPLGPAIYGSMVAQSTACEDLYGSSWTGGLRCRTF